MERVTGIEPVSAPWQGAVLPLYDTRVRKERHYRTKGKVLPQGNGGKLVSCVSAEPHVRKDIDQGLFEILIRLRHHDAGKAVGSAIVHDDELVVANAFNSRIGRSFEDMENRLLAIHGDRLGGDRLVVWRGITGDLHGK